jgi:single-strand DNA-binding protein
MNKVILIGRLTADPELKTTQSGKSVTEVSIAVDRRYAPEGSQKADFVFLSVWGTSAEALCKYGYKGLKIAVDGELRIDSYQDQSGAKRYKTYILVNQWEFCESRQQQNTAPATDYTADVVPIGTDDDQLPF